MKIGDSIVCIVTNYSFVVYGKVYTIMNNDFVDNNIEINHIWYNKKDFVSIKEYRKVKLKRLGKSSLVEPEVKK